MKRTLLSAALAAVSIFGAGVAAAASFTYHGNLQDAGKPADGKYDIELTLYSAATGGTVVGGPLKMYKVPVRDGSFSTEVDFGPLTRVAGTSWLGVGVRAAGKEEFASLDTRAPVAADTTATACPGSWDLMGNSGNPDGSYLGTADGRDLLLEVNAQRVAQFRKAINATYPDAPNIALGHSANSFDVLSSGAAIGGGGTSSVSDCGPNSNLSCRNETEGDFATVGGGLGNFADRPYAVVAGGARNIVSGMTSTISGGENNTVSGQTAVVGGGEGNMAAGIEATVGGGGGNFASSTNDTVAGGLSNRALGGYATVAGGEGNRASGSHAMIVGGNANTAGGRDSFAAGYHAKVRHPGADDITGSGTGTASGDDGTFVWSDDALSASFESTGTNQFLVRASGGFAINAPPPNPDVELTVASNAGGPDYSNLFMRQRAASNNGILISVGDGTGSNNAGFYIDNYNGSAQFRRMQLANDGSAYIHSNVTGSNTGVTLPSNGGSWSSLSDRNVKTAIASIDPVDVLDRLTRMPVSAWSYIAQGEGIRHIGPMAQDFSAAFSFGEDDTHISTVDADGVAFAAIQGLNKKLEGENAELRSKLDGVLGRLSKLEAGKGQ